LEELDAQKMYLAPSWYCLFAGKGRFPGELTIPPDGTKIAPALDASAYCQRQSRFFVNHKAQLLKTYGQDYPDPMAF